MRIWGLVVLATGCSAIEFERSPYTVRDLQMVYSVQEDITFFVWRLRHDADPGLVRFELYRDGGYQRVELEQALFAAEPYACTKKTLCFQYQVRGRYQPPGDRGPLRSRHTHEGYYAGPVGELWEAARTFDIDPIGLGKNDAIDARRSDWFDDNDVPMVRAFEWQLFDAPCDRAVGSSWKTLDGDLPFAGDGAELFQRCLAVRSTPRDHRPTEVTAALEPSAETRHDEQTYTPPTYESPIVYGVLLDLYIPNSERCALVKSTLLSAIENAVAGTGSPTRLGVYTPVNVDTGGATSGCDQGRDQEYPVEEMLEDNVAHAVLVPAVEDVDDNLRTLWIYANNIESTPSARMIQDLSEFFAYAELDQDLLLYTWAIGSNTVMSAMPWDQTTGWRPIEHDSFRSDIREMAELILPFTTMVHDELTPVTIGSVPGVVDPQYFKLCRCTPVHWSTISGPGLSVYDLRSKFVPWPSPGNPYFFIPFMPQNLVQSGEYQRVKATVHVEVCERFCDQPFRSQSGRDYPSWQEPEQVPGMEICQWWAP